MSLRDWFATKRNHQPNKQLDNAAMNLRLSDDDICKLWTKCYSCQENLPSKELADNLKVCNKCGYHFRIGARDRITQLVDTEAGDSFEELDACMVPGDPLGFEDTEKYVVRQEAARQKSKLHEAIVTGVAKIQDVAFALGIMDFGYLGGSMGSVVGEKVTRLAEHALQNKLPLVIFSSSGGARMQEGTLSLMQMAKSGAALAMLHEAGLLYISVLAEPTFGGVTASYGTLGDILIAEEGARIGFAGRRVIEQTIRQKLPSDFQTANYLLNYGQLDMVINRQKMRDTLCRLIALHQKSAGQAVTSQTRPEEPVHAPV
ncbi:MAG: acetyl-CoA carboxylase, carboxyltransferase subunit beta [Vampirovibrio sp.]|nr:acetyl-CoA carboxylase, carboxyltransferase subunit beta [Vampirovibrio sp.]